MQVLIEAFEISKEEGLIFLDRTAKRNSVLVALKARRRAWVEIIGGIQGVISQIFVDRSVEKIRSGLRDNQNLRARALAIVCTVGITENVELAHGIRAQQLLAGAPRLHIVFSSTGDLDSVQQEEILLGAVSGDSKIIADGRIRNANSAGFLPSEIDYARIERQQLVIAAAVEREILHLLRANEARHIRRGDADDGSVAIHSDLLADVSDSERLVHRAFLIHGEMDSRADRFGEASLLESKLVFAGRKGDDSILAFGVGCRNAEGAGVHVFHGDGGIGDGGSGGVGNGS